MANRFTWAQWQCLQGAGDVRFMWQPTGRVVMLVRNGGCDDPDCDSPSSCDHERVVAALELDGDELEELEQSVAEVRRRYDQRMEKFYAEQDDQLVAIEQDLAALRESAAPGNAEIADIEQDLFDARQTHERLSAPFYAKRAAKATYRQQLARGVPEEWAEKTTLAKHGQELAATGVTWKRPPR